MKRGGAVAVATVTVCLALGACGDVVPGAPSTVSAGSTGAQSSTSAPSSPTPAASPPSSVEPAPGPRASGCVRGGSTRDEVLGAMGPPDSVVFGAYVYGRSQILFGYGVVQEWSNAGRNLVLC